ncbi:ABC transporter substrate-binding protein [Ruania rhizosphaerae]|uniref:ABC transporter substrate-binding protein n=1 Tax=Ruania rhizosphaerae TaxID=1840413 RepID=UPI00135B90D1|nr:ABC transporter substrate-binding protein [Ruania rhizosphaerae]
MTRLRPSGGQPAARPRGLVGRRRVVAATALTATAALLAACTGEPVDDPSESSAGEPASSGEAPMLAELVESGELPPVEERLPEDPLVVEPTEQVGQYGGTWRTATTGPGDEVWLDLTIGYEGLVRWASDWTGAPGDAEVIPNIAAGYEVSEDSQEFTFTLREGMRWSDGEPFTTADIEFAFNDLWTDEDLASIRGLGAGPLMHDGELATLQVEDDYTFTIAFDQPNGMFLSSMASGGAGANTLIAPRHYLEEYLPQYNDDLDDLVESEGYDSWQDLLAAKFDYNTNTDYPVMNPWVITEPLGTGSRVEAERNPYYFKVDTAGNQLPYLDAVRYTVMNEPEVMLAAAMQGDIDMHSRHFNEPANKPVLAEARAEGNYDFFELAPGLANELVVMFNLTHEDDQMREIFTNRDFRVGLSHAIDRDELVNTVYQRQGTPSQVSPQPTSPFYDEEMATQYTEFDVDLANQYLDDAGYAERDSEGRRLGPDGEPITFSVEHAGLPGFEDALALISDDWADVGITMTPDPMDRSLFEERRRSNNFDAVVWLAGGGTDVTQNPYWYAPLSDRSDFASLWAQWYTTGGEDGEEPPAATQEQFELYDELLRTADAEGQQDLMEQLLQITAEEFYHIGTVRPGAGYGIVSNDFHNVPTTIPDSYRVKTPALSNPEQYYLAQ